MPAPDLVLPPLLSESDVASGTWARVQRLNRMGDQEQPLILASMYRHLSNWPAFLERVEATLAPAQQDGSLQRCIDENATAARSRARVIAQVIAQDNELPALPRESGKKIETAIAAFIDHAINKMVTICRAIRVARGTPL